MTRRTLLESLVAAYETEDTRQASSAIPWREIVGTRNRALHAYFDIDLGLVWDTACDNWQVPLAPLDPLDAGGSVLRPSTGWSLILPNPSLGAISAAIGRLVSSTFRTVAGPQDVFWHRDNSLARPTI